MVENFLAEAWSELALALIAIGLRLYFRITHVGIRKLGWDDLLMVCAGVSALVPSLQWKNFVN